MSDTTHILTDALERIALSQAAPPATLIIIATDALNAHAACPGRLTYVRPAKDRVGLIYVLGWPTGYQVLRFDDEAHAERFAQAQGLEVFHCPRLTTEQHAEAARKADLLSRFRFPKRRTT